MADLSSRTGLAEATPPLLPPIDPSEQRKFVCHYLNSQSCWDDDPEQGRSFIDAVDLLKGDHAKCADEALARSMAKPIWRADFAALLLHGYYLDDARGMDALEHLRRISSAVGQDGVTEVTALIKTYDAVRQDKKTRRVEGELELKRADVFRIAVGLDFNTEATRIPAIFIGRYEAVSNSARSLAFALGSGLGSSDSGGARPNGASAGRRPSSQSRSLAVETQSSSL